MASIEEETPVERKSIITTIREHIFSRISGIHLPLLWEPDALEFIPFTIRNNSDVTETEEEELPEIFKPFGLGPLEPISFGLEPLGPPLVNPFASALSESIVDPYESPGFPSLSEYNGGIQ